MIKLIIFVLLSRDGVIPRPNPELATLLRIAEKARLPAFRSPLPTLPIRDPVDDVLADPGIVV
jgi:hypothetical protein